MTGDRAIAIDATVILVASAAICAAGRQLAFMTLLVIVLIAVRLVLWAFLPRAERDTSAGGEIALLAICTAVGAFNDYRSVVVHRVYDYYLPGGSIPLWMLLYWGLILRFVLTLFSWRRLQLEARRSVLAIALELALVVATRQAIYRFFLDPWLSWLPFASALVVAAVVLRPARRELGVLAAFAAGGTAVEIAYIQVGGLHRYHLGAIGGVPLWIALWWPLAALVWRDVGGALVRALRMLEAGAPASARTGSATR